MSQAQKLIKLEEMVGQRKEEEEPEREVIAGPSGEVVEPLSSGNTPFSSKSNYLFNLTSLLVCKFSFFVDGCCSSCLVTISLTETGS